jgi:hypothetical protein
MRRNQMKTRTFAFCRGIIIILMTGCAHDRGIPRCQFMPAPSAQAWIFNAPPEQVWQAAQDVAFLEPGHQILAKSESSRILSWLSPEQSSRDLFCDASVVRASICPISTPLTTVWVENDADTNRCCLYIKRIYTDTEAVSGLGPSRGDYESLFISVLQSRLPDIPVSPKF